MADSAAAKEVNWKQYFQKIRVVCPWSWSAWQKGQIHIQTWDGQIADLGDYEARVFVCPGRNFRTIKKWSKRYNLARPHEEWLWSHPEFGNYSTPVPVLIQQDRKKLDYLRKRLNNCNTALEGRE